MCVFGESSTLVVEPVNGNVRSIQSRPQDPLRTRQHAFLGRYDAGGGEKDSSAAGLEKDLRAEKSHERGQGDCHNDAVGECEGILDGATPKSGEVVSA